MRILILGGAGMLGHQLWRHFAGRHETWVALRRPAVDFARWGLFDPPRTVSPVDVADPAAVARLVAAVQPDAVLNGVGIIKQLKEAHDPIPSITLNSLVPHQLAEICRAVHARLILFSTDCVFSGRRGGYRESDVADAEDLYGRTKLLGEIDDQSHVVTLRSSIVGRELGTAHSLVDWFLSQQGGRVRGYRRAIYSGFTTIEMARIVERVLVEFPTLAGRWHVASTPIDKYELLKLLRRHFNATIDIEPYDDIVCDRSLDGSRFARETGYIAPPWEEMVRELAVAPL